MKTGCGNTLHNAIMKYEGGKYWYNLRKADIEYLREVDASISDYPLLDWDSSRKLKHSLSTDNGAVAALPSGTVVDRTQAPWCELHECEFLPNPAI